MGTKENFPGGIASGEGGGFGGEARGERGEKKERGEGEG